MTKQRAEALIRKRIGEIPILQMVIQRLRLREIVLSYIKPHGNETVPAADTLLVLVWNIACGRQPLYELPEWVAKLDGGLLGHTVDAAENPYGDDRFARALDKLYAADRASMVTDIALRVIETTGVDLSELHNDSTTVKSFGSMPGKTATGLYFTQGHSKDHRPDLKQIVYNLTISADGAIPIHYKTYPGNRTDDTLHIETWNALRRITGKADFLYVADSKVCTHKQLSHIVRHGGRVVTLMPETWKEAGDFKATLRQTAKAKKRILRRPLHYALDVWCEEAVKAHCQGAAYLCRYADDFVCAFELEADAERFYSVLGNRLAKFGLEVAAEKTNLIRFSPVNWKASGAFEFLGFEFRWGLGRWRKPVIKRRTDRKKYRAALANLQEWCRKNCRLPKKVLFAKLNSKLRGYYNYYGIRGNYDSLNDFFHHAKRILFKVLNRRSQRRSYNWKGFADLITVFKLRKPRICHSFCAIVRCRLLCEASNFEEPRAVVPHAGICTGAVG